MRDGCRFDTRGYLVRLIFGHRPQVFELPGRVERKIWRFTNGIAVRDPSLSVALDLVNEISGLKQATEG